MNLQPPFKCPTRVKVMIGLLIVGCGLSVFGQVMRNGSNPPLRQPVGREGVPNWETRSDFPAEQFTFVRLRYRSTQNHFRTHWSGDYPDADLNLSYRLQQLTSLNVSPNGLVLDINDERLLDYPFAFMSSPGKMYLNTEEVESLRNYLSNGGFLMVDDFWGREYRENVTAELSRVLPGVTPVDLPLSHPIFHTVYDLREKPQVPSINAWSQGLDIEPWHGDMSDPDPHFLAYHDENGKILILLCHNNDLADGWEREGENKAYYERFSERWSYPIAINIIVYAMTH
ncbi:MAG: DUF4159 domain-containing protein [Rubripirellula sp.]